MEELTLEKFEEASEIVKEVTWRQNWFTASIFPPRRETRFTLSRRICSTPGLIR